MRVCLCVGVCVRVCLRALVLLCVKDRDREREREKERVEDAQAHKESHKQKESQTATYARSTSLRVTPPTHTTQHTSLFGARRLRQRLSLIPRCLLPLRLLSRGCLLIRQRLCGLRLCCCFCRSRLSSAPTSQLQSQFSCSVLPGNGNGHFLSSKSVSIFDRDTRKNFKMVSTSMISIPQNHTVLLLNTHTN